MFNPASDLTALQKILNTDPIILNLMDLSGQKLTDAANKYLSNHPGTTLELAKNIIIAQRIIKRSQYSDLVDGKLLCIYFKPSKNTRNDSFKQEVIQIDCHVPALEDYKAYQIQERIKILLHHKKINKCYTYFEGQLGELPTMSGYFCCGSRYKFYRNI